MRRVFGAIPRSITLCSGLATDICSLLPADITMTSKTFAQPILTPDPAMEKYCGPIILAIAMFALVYGVELFSFGLSIDEEVSTYVADIPMVSVQQGRWGFALLSLALPAMGALPLVSTVILGAGLVFATWRAVSDFALSRNQAYLFAAVHVGFPVWLHIAQFNTLAAGFGFGLAAAVAGAAAAVRGGRSGIVAGAVLIAFSISIYQTLAVYSALYILLSLHAKMRESLWARQLFRATATWLAGMVVYILIQKIGLAIMRAESSYVGEFVQVQRLLTEPAAAAKGILGYLGLLVGGTHSAYLGWGPAVLFLTWLGLLPLGLVNPQTERQAAIHRWLWILATAAMGAGLLALPIIMSVATLPLRAHIALPLLAAWVASRTDLGNTPLAKAVLWAGIGYFALVSASIGSRLFYADQVTHNADAALTQRLAVEILKATGDIPKGRQIPITLVGQRSFSFKGQLQRTELFGMSFYEHDGGHPDRVTFYMWLQGINDVTPVLLSDRPDLVPSALEMTAWPAAGSVKMVNGVVIIKLGNPTPQQLPASQ